MFRFTNKTKKKGLDCSFFRWVDYVKVKTLLLRLGINIDQRDSINNVICHSFSFEKVYFRPLFQLDSFLVHGSMVDDRRNNFFHCAMRRTNDPTPFWLNSSLWSSWTIILSLVDTFITSSTFTYTSSIMLNLSLSLYYRNDFKFC